MRDEPDNKSYLYSALIVMLMASAIQFLVMHWIDRRLDLIPIRLKLDSVETYVLLVLASVGAFWIALISQLGLVSAYGHLRRLLSR